VSSWRGFIDIGIDYVNTFTNGFRYSFNEYPQDDIGILECKVHPLARPCRQFLEHHLATIAQMAQRALPDIEGFTTNFQHDGDASHPIYEKAFRGSVNFNAGTNSIHVPLKYLERKVVEASPLIRATRYLCETNFTLSQIASILDYSSQETFIQAFYRWHRKTPKEFRNENQHKGAAE